MRNILKAIILGLVCAFVIIQFIKPDRNNSGQASQQSMMQLYHPPDNIRLMLQQSCLDCHSNNTHYPWYANVQPFGWWLNHHIRKGKKELNLDEFAEYSDRRKISKLRSMKDQVKDDEMPLNSYVWMHPNALLSKTQKIQLVNWLSKKIDSLNQ